MSLHYFLNLEMPKLEQNQEPIINNFIEEFKFKFKHKRWCWCFIGTAGDAVDQLQELNNQQQSSSKSKLSMLFNIFSPWLY